MLLCIHRKGEAISFKLIEVAEYERPFPIGVNKKRCFPIGCGRIWKGFSNWCKQNNRVFSYWVWHNMKGLFSYWCKQNNRVFSFWVWQNMKGLFSYWCKQNKRFFPMGCDIIWKGFFLMGVNKLKCFFLLGKRILLLLARCLLTFSTHRIFIYCCLICSFR